MSEHESYQSDEGIANEYSELLQDRERVTAEFESAVEPKLETPAFTAEMDDPSYQTENGMTFGVFRVNREYSDSGLPPLIVNLGHGEAVRSGAGRADINAFAQTISRPIIAIDMAGMGDSIDVNAKKLATTSFDQLAASHLAIIDSLGVGEFDLVGNSMGSIMAVKIAELAGERARHLITFSSPSFEKRGAFELIRASREQNSSDFASSRESLADLERAELVRERQDATRVRKDLKPRDRATTALAVLRYAALMRQPHMSELTGKLAPSTKWSDITGSEDAFSDYGAHLAEVRRRNAEYPRSSSSLILGKETHAWQAHYRWEVAAMAAAELAK